MNDNPYESPQAVAADVVNYSKARLATRSARLAGALIDVLIAGAVFIPYFVATGMRQQVLSGGSLSLRQQAASFLIGILIFLALHGYLLYRRGQTIGKYFMGTRIVDMHGNIPSFGGLLVRRYLILSLIGQIPVIGGPLVTLGLLLIFGKERRCLHDYLAGTRVVYAPTNI